MGVKPLTDLVASQSKLTDRPSILRELKQGAAFTLKKKDYESLLSRIKDGNSVLQDLTRQNYVLEPSRRHRSQLRVIRLMRRLTQSIFNALLNSTTCKCVRPHHVGLELTSRNMVLIPDDDDDQAAKRLDFNVIWGNHGDSIKVGTGSSSQNAAKTYPRTCWESFRIQLADMAQEKQASSPVIAQGVGPDATAKVARRVKWSHSVSFRSRKQVTISGTQTSVVEARSPTVVPILGDHVFSEVSNLCRIFPGCKGSAVDCYGYINDVERRFWLYPRLQRAGPCTTYTLRELLEDKGPLNGAFGYQEKLNVALALSVSVMHLHNTRWLAGKISLDDVIFLLDDEAPLSQGYSPYQPFMTRNLMGESTNRTEHPGPPRRILRPINLTILSLAALLIQVIIGSVVNALELAGNLDISTILSKTEAAGQLASHTRELGGPNYENAVKWCLKSVLEVAGFEDDNFCQEFYGGVVALLETDAKLLRLID